MKNSDSSVLIHDSIVVGGLISSPAWAPSLSNLNDALTTATLIVGLLLGLARLWLVLRSHSNKE